MGSQSLSGEVDSLNEIHRTLLIQIAKLECPSSPHQPLYTQRQARGVLQVSVMSEWKAQV